MSKRQELADLIVLLFEKQPERWSFSNEVISYSHAGNPHTLTVSCPPPNQNGRVFVYVSFGPLAVELGSTGARAVFEAVRIWKISKFEEAATDILSSIPKAEP